MYRNRKSGELEDAMTHSKLRQIVGWRRSADASEDDPDWLDTEVEAASLPPVRRTRVPDPDEG